MAGNIMGSSKGLLDNLWVNLLTSAGSVVILTGVVSERFATPFWRVVAVAMGAALFILLGRRLVKYWKQIGTALSEDPEKLPAPARNPLRELLQPLAFAAFVMLLGLDLFAPDLLRTDPDPAWVDYSMIAVFVVLICLNIHYYTRKAD